MVGSCESTTRAPLVAPLQCPPRFPSYAQLRIRRPAAAPPQLRLELLGRDALERRRPANRRGARLAEAVGVQDCQVRPHKSFPQPGAEIKNSHYWEEQDHFTTIENLTY